MNADVYRSPSGQQAVERSYRENLQRWDVPLRHRIVATREGDTFVLDCGPADAPPALLLHGAGSNSAIWLTDASRWSLTNRLYMVDIIGEPGLSAQSRPPLDSDAYALWLDDVLDRLGVDAGGFVGVSLGGWLATDYAIRRPDRVERLALRSPGGIGRQRYGAVLAALALMPFGERGTRRALRIALGPGSVPDPVIDYMLLIQRNYRPRRDTLPVFSDDDLKAVCAPLLVVLGARDRMLNSRDTVARLTRLQPAAAVNLLAGAGHGLFDNGAVIHTFLNRGPTP
ncbi:alpha/beta fold hydrolase [Mycolicibacterium sp. 018/SC-01/001]|uniref:alpha/beta fold hydrolase n=1 Tax=Mycolicibacterium sp. 018/SC-01/001 TaxID=2592069 RepID=UPI0011807064|nr:alpha/beta fold hydrolase [Mycolicibacterium sp. 018/SC-01/001]TRW80256.1 alpha/beta fold hydrolase [Mycolicibacterium sp. 018/SC-01/001]